MKRPKIMLIAEPPSLVLGLIPTQGCPVYRRILLPERLIVLMALLLTWVMCLGAVGALIFWGIRRLSGTHA
jgi:ABC-type sulfate transport system permease component